MRSTEPNTYNPNANGLFLEPFLGVDSLDLSKQVKFMNCNILMVE